MNPRYLKVPFSEENISIVKDAGCKFDSENKLWYFPDVNVPSVISKFVNNEFCTLSDIEHQIASFVKNTLSKNLAGIEVRDLELNYKISESFYKNTYLKTEAKYLDVAYQNSKSTLIVSKADYERHYKGILVYGAQVNVTVQHLNYRGSSLDIYPSKIIANGLSVYNDKKQKLIEEISRLGINNRQKRESNPRIDFVHLITSKNCGVEADVTTVFDKSGIGYSLNYIANPNEAIQLLQRIKAVAGHNDVIAFFRGGHEDVGMEIFSDLDLFIAISNIGILTISGFNHEQDKPVIERIVDVACNTPTDMARFIQNHNLAIARAERSKALAEAAEKRKKRHNAIIIALFILIAALLLYIKIKH